MVNRHGIPIIIVIVEKLVTIVLRRKFEDYLSGDLIKPIHHILSFIINEKIRHLRSDHDLKRKIKQLVNPTRAERTTLICWLVVTTISIPSRNIGI